MTPRRDNESFFHRHFRPPSAFGIIVIVLVSAVLAGFLGAAVWAANDNEQLRGAPEPPPPPTIPTAAGDEQVTTTTRLDLSLDTMDRKLRPMVWTVTTLDAGGQPSLGSAFSAGATEGQSLLLTSLAVVEAGTRAPAPPITVEGEGYSGPATLWTWQESTDLALLVIPKGSLPALPWADPSPPTKPGDQIFAVGSQRVTPGIVSTFLPSSIQHSVFVDDPMRGAPLVNVKGEVLGIASAAYAGGGVPTDTAFFGVPIRAACVTVINCPGITAPEPGDSPTTTSGRTGTTRRSTATTQPSDDTDTTEPETTEP